MEMNGMEDIGRVLGKQIDERKIWDPVAQIRHVIARYDAKFHPVLRHASRQMPQSGHQLLAWTALGKRKNKNPYVG